MRAKAHCPTHGPTPPRALSPSEGGESAGHSVWRRLLDGFIRCETHNHPCCWGAMAALLLVLAAGATSARDTVSQAAALKNTGDIGAVYDMIDRVLPSGAKAHFTLAIDPAACGSSANGVLHGCTGWVCHLVAAARAPNPPPLPQIHVRHRSSLLVLPSRNVFRGMQKWSNTPCIVWPASQPRFTHSLHVNV